VKGGMLVATNLAKAWAVAIFLCGVLGAIGWELGGYRAASISLFCGMLIAGATYWYADRAIMGMVQARELPLAEAPAIHSTLEGIAARARVVKPRLYLVDTGYPCVLSAGRGPTSSAIAVSSGLASLLRPAELEGVLAHEVAHVRSRDVMVQSISVVIASALVEVTRIGGWFERALLFFLGPFAAAVVHLLLSRRREFAADRAAATLCDSPHSLADALVSLEQAGDLVSFRGSPATEPLYIVNPFDEEGLAALFVTHPPVGDRVSRLRDLDPAWRERLRAA
jgi:heat shock protein HtpX